MPLFLSVLIVFDDRLDLSKLVFNFPFVGHEVREFDSNIAQSLVCAYDCFVLPLQAVESDLCSLCHCIGTAQIMPKLPHFSQQSL